MPADSEDGGGSRLPEIFRHGKRLATMSLALLGTSLISGSLGGAIYCHLTRPVTGGL